VVGGDGPIAFDSAGNAWIGGSSGVTELTSAWSAAAGSPFSGGGECGYCTQGIAIDGAGNVWLSDGEFVSPFRVGLSELSNSGAAVSSPTGYQTSYLGYPLGIAIDGSGNVWVADGGIGSLDIIEFIGAAVPVVTPLAAGVASNTLGTRP
jgi:sugar lactone lactonase YvrE